MSLLDEMPHECTIRRKVNTQGTLGKGKQSYTNEYTGVPCWEQPLSASEINDYQKRGIKNPIAVYFNTDYSLTERHQVLITKREGTTVSSPLALDVKDVGENSVGLQLLWKVVCERIPSREQ